MLTNPINNSSRDLFGWDFSSGKNYRGFGSFKLKRQDLTTKYFQFNWGLLWGFLGLTVIQCSEKESSINLPPRAVFTVYPKEGTLDTIFNLDASNSSDPEDDPALLTVRWDWENDQNWDTDYSSLKTDTHQFSSSGDKIIRMEVRDSSGLFPLWHVCCSMVSLNEVRSR